MPKFWPWSLNTIDLVTLRLFLAVVDDGNIHRAARRESIAISAVSRRIADLEVRCGVQLLDRHSRGVTPTSAGRLLANHVRNVVSYIEEMIQDLESTRKGERGFVKIASHMTAIADDLAGRLASFMSLNDHVDIEFNEMTSREVIAAVRAGTADIGIFSGTLEARDIQLIPWKHDELVAIVPLGHPLLRSEKISFADLIAEPFVCMQQDSALLSLFRSHATAQGKFLYERTHLASFDSVRRAVSAGIGVSILPKAAANQEGVKPGYDSRPLGEEWALRPLMMCVGGSNKITPLVEKVIEHLLNSVSVVRTCGGDRSVN